MKRRESPLGFTLHPNEGASIRYSPTERDLFALIPQNGKRTNTEELTKLLYRDRQRPFDARRGIGHFIRTLARKIEYNDEPFRIQRSEQRGSNPIEIWIEPKNSKAQARG